MMTFDRRGVFLALAVWAAWAAAGAAEPTAPGLSGDDARDVARAVAYLEGLTNARGRFVQTDARGGRMEGALVLQRPGRARFDYDPPSGLVVASDGHKVTVVDHRLKTIRSYPLGLTPLGLFLGRNIRLDRGVGIARVTHEADTMTIVAVEGSHAEKGSIALHFADRPLALTGWTLTDARGAVIRVRLEDLTRSKPQEPGFFTLGDPRPKADPEAIP